MPEFGEITGGETSARDIVARDAVAQTILGQAVEEDDRRAGGFAAFAGMGFQIGRQYDHQVRLVAQQQVHRLVSAVGLLGRG